MGLQGINGIKSEVAGATGDGTSIDFDEPFTLNLSCDQDGWNLQVNTELPYDSVLHAVSLENLTVIKVTGDIVINFIGIGGKGNENVSTRTFYSKLELNATHN